jgi:hypothetical protein
MSLSVPCTSVGLLKKLNCLRRENGVYFIRDGFAVLDAVGDDSQSERLDIGTRLPFGGPISQNTRECWYFAYPTAVVFQCYFDTKHGALLRRRVTLGAGEAIRTPDPNLGKVMLYP